MLYLNLAMALVVHRVTCSLVHRLLAMLFAAKVFYSCVYIYCTSTSTVRSALNPFFVVEILLVVCFVLPNFLLYSIHIVHVLDVVTVYIRLQCRISYIVSTNHGWPANSVICINVMHVRPFDEISVVSVLIQ